MLTTDWHCHLLPGIDDGPQTWEEAVVMARGLREAGFNRVYCTPHLMRGAFEADRETVDATRHTLQTRLRREGIELELMPGREYYLDEYFPEYLRTSLPLGETSFLMMEIPAIASPDLVKDACYAIHRQGLIPMIAHPERCRLFALPKRPARPDPGDSCYDRSFLPRLWSRIRPSESKRYAEQLVRYLQELDCAFQGNLLSFAGRYGDEVCTSARRLQRAGVFTHFGTDLHSAAGLEFLERAMKNR